MQLVNLTLWYEALGSTKGVVIQTDDPARCIQRLYKLRTEALDPDLADISIVQSPLIPGQLWLVKRKAKPDGPQGNTGNGESDPEPIQG